MKKILVAISFFSVVLATRAGIASEKRFPLWRTDGLTAIGVDLAALKWKGRSAVRLRPGQGQGPDSHTLAMINGAVFRDGTIEVKLAGAPTESSANGDGLPGFVGIAFRVGQGTSAYEYIYLRPGVSRRADQLARNHSTQYASHPSLPWSVSRKATPGLYESYVDLVPGVWTSVRIEVAGTRARLYVNDAAEPSLVVNDLKLGDVEGGVALWIGPATEAYFADLRVSNNAGKLAAAANGPAK